MAAAVAGGLGLGASPGSVRLEPTWRTKKRSESEAAPKAEESKNNNNKAKPRTTMMSEVPVKAPPRSDLQRELRRWGLAQSEEELLLKAFPDLPALLKADKDALHRAGLTSEAIKSLESHMVGFCKEPWEKASLAVPASAQPQRLPLNSLEVEALVVNVHEHLRCIEAQLGVTERTIRNLSPGNLAVGGFEEKDNAEALISAALKVEDECGAVSARSTLLRRLLAEKAGLQHSAKKSGGEGGVSTETKVWVGVGALILASSAVYFAHRRLSA